jgi:hypothetical protein
MYSVHVKSGLKYYTKLGIYKNSRGTLTFNPETGKGHSYGWYEIARKFGKYQVVNSYSYSSTTVRHIGNIRNLLNYNSFIEIEAPKGLQDLDEAIKLYEKRIQELMLSVNNPRTNPTVNVARVKRIKECLKKIEFINKIKKYK